MRRFLGAVLVGLGAFLIVVAVGLPLFVAPAVTKLPYDLQACPAPPAAGPSGCLKPSIVEAQNARFLQLKKDTNGNASINVDTATLRIAVEVIPNVKLTADEQAAGRLTDDSVVWDVYTTATRVDTGEVISKSSVEVALDRVSGAAVDWKGQWIDESTEKDTSIAFSDQVYKFPFNTQKKDYKIYDSDVRAASTAKFTSVDTIDGVEAYHFVQQIPDTQVNVAADSVKTLLGRFSPAATSGKVIYRNTREVWVDPVTGAYLKVREQPHQELQPNTGTAVVLLDADLSYTKDTVAGAVSSAKSNGFQLKIVNRYGPIGAGVLGIVFLIGGFLLARRRPAPTATEGGAWDESLPAPRRQLRDQSTNDVFSG